MEKLTSLKCQACSVGAPTLNDEQIKLFLEQIPEWQVVIDNNIKKLFKIFKFKDFKQTLDFLNKVGVISEEQGHHPLVVVEYNKLSIWWWTHKINGLHSNDFIMAAKTDALSQKST